MPAAGKYGVFLVEEARGSPYIPAQEFVEKYGLRSIVGCGGAPASGDLFAVILFSRVPIDAATTGRFRAIALDVQSGAFSFAQEQVSTPHVALRNRTPGPARRPELVEEGRVEPPRS